MISQYLSDFVVVMGLGALLIGGVGIMNTMLVLVRRRTGEIAAVKTFGLRGSQVAALFLTEGLMLGFIGSCLGIVVGIGLSLIVNEYGSVALAPGADLAKVYPEALLFRLHAGHGRHRDLRRRPHSDRRQGAPQHHPAPQREPLGRIGSVAIHRAACLRHHQPGLGRRSNPASLARVDRGPAVASGARALARRPPLTRAARLIAPAGPRTISRIGSDQTLPSPYLVGVLGVGATFLIFLLLIALLWLLIFLIGRLPSLGLVTWRLALRNLSTNRIRTAITLLALSAGMFALSSITFVGEGTRELLNLQLSRTFGGNVLVFPFPGLPSLLVTRGIDGALQDVAIDYRTTITSYELPLAAVNSGSVKSDDRLDVTVWDSDKPDIYDGQAPVQAGRMLTVADRGQALVVLPYEVADRLHLKVGDRIALGEAEGLTLQVLGILSQSQGPVAFGGVSAIVPPDVLPASISSDFTLYAFQIPPEDLNRALAELSSVIFALAIDVQFIDGLIGRLIDQFAAIPTVVALLSLFAAAVIMANTVALSTLERRRQIGILKAIGLKPRRVLAVMFIESSLVGLLSALIGIGLSALLISLLSAAGGIVIPLPTDARLTAGALLIAALLIGWLATFLSARVALHERVMNVLRYD